MRASSDKLLEGLDFLEKVLREEESKKAIAMKAYREEKERDMAERVQKARVSTDGKWPSGVLTQLQRIVMCADCGTRWDPRMTVDDCCVGPSDTDMTCNQL